jgi:hypothetical protein
MKKISIKLSSGEVIFCGMASSLLSYLLVHMEQILVPLHGNRDYVVIHNIYCEEHKAFVTYIAHD